MERATITIAGINRSVYFKAETLAKIDELNHLAGRADGLSQTIRRLVDEEYTRSLARKLAPVSEPERKQKGK